MGIFYCLGAALTARSRVLANGLVAALVVWLVVVLIIPQIGDTMDPDNQLPGGLFRSMNLDKDHEARVLAEFSTYERLRNDLEETSFAKQYERFSFAILEIKVKDKFRDTSIGYVIDATRRNIEWLALVCRRDGRFPLLDCESFDRPPERRRCVIARICRIEAFVVVLLLAGFMAVAASGGAAAVSSMMQTAATAGDCATPSGSPEAFSLIGLASRDTVRSGLAGRVSRGELHCQLPPASYPPSAFPPLTGSFCRSPRIRSRTRRPRPA